MTEKYKILLVSDHLASTSGVGTQSRWLSLGLANTGKYTIRQLGGAIKHKDMNVVKFHDDILIKPVNGFGNKELIRPIITSEKPDVVLIFNDPRFFIQYFECEDEIHDICPIAYNHLWDNMDYVPEFNKVYYESVDLINCINIPTYEVCKKWFPQKTNYIPHALPKELYFPMSEKDALNARKTLFGLESQDMFLGLWVNRNARRKRPSDLIEAWKFFIEYLGKNHGEQAVKNAKLILHTDVEDQEGTNLLVVARLLGIEKHIIFSTERVNFDQMNMLYNAIDFTINVSHSEGFGLATLESMMCAKPIIVPKTGGMTRQVMNDDGTMNGIGLDIELRTIVGSLVVPIISEDYVSSRKFADAIIQMYEIGPEKRKEFGQKAYKHALKHYNMNRLISEWDRTLTELIERWRREKECIYKPWEIKEF